jgi:hypothetical protein
MPKTPVELLIRRKLQISAANAGSFRTIWALEGAGRSMLKRDL